MTSIVIVCNDAEGGGRVIVIGARWRWRRIVVVAVVVVVVVIAAVVDRLKHIHCRNCTDLDERSFALYM